jgi:hypothetical protein
VGVELDYRDQEKWDDIRGKGEQRQVETSERCDEKRLQAWGIT